MEIQVTFDAADPGRLADFWAYALRYKRDDPPSGYTSWHGFLKDRGVPEENWNDADAIVPRDGSGPRIFFQKVPEAKTAKNRIHLDVPVAHGFNGETFMSVLEARADELENWGATRLKRFEPDAVNKGWIVMADPEGNEFCLD